MVSDCRTTIAPHKQQKIAKPGSKNHFECGKDIRYSVKEYSEHEIKDHHKRMGQIDIPCHGFFFFDSLDYLNL